MPTTTMVQIHVDEDVKAQATETLAAMGLSLSDAVCAFLTRVAADKRIPFDINAPTAQELAASLKEDIKTGRVQLFEPSEPCEEFPYQRH